MHSDDDNDDEIEYRPRRSNAGPLIALCLFGVFVCVAIGIIIYKNSSDKSASKIGAKNAEAVDRPKAAKPKAVEKRIDVDERPIEREGRPRERANDIEAAAFVGSLAFFLIIGGVLAVAFLILHILLMIWIVRDARNRSLDGDIMWLIATLLFGLIVWLIYLASRPPGDAGLLPEVPQQAVALREDLPALRLGNERRSGGIAERLSRQPGRAAAQEIATDCCVNAGGGCRNAFKDLERIRHARFCVGNSGRWLHLVRDGRSQLNGCRGGSQIPSSRQEQEARET
jgi:hypothetical protein